MEPTKLPIGCKILDLDRTPPSDEERQHSAEGIAVLGASRIAIEAMLGDDCQSFADKTGLPLIRAGDKSGQQ